MPDLTTVGRYALMVTWRILVVLFWVAAIGAIFALAFWFQHRDPGQWGWDDWGALANSIWLGFLFFGLATWVGRGSERRATAVADAELITSMGSLAMSSARSFAGHDQQALRIAADARAALQQYPQASEAQQKQLVETIENSYSDLAFGTFSRADALPRSVWDQLCQGAEAVQQEADRLVRELRSWTNWRGKHTEDRCTELAGMAAHVRFVQRIGVEIRAAHLVRGVRELAGIWTEPADPQPRVLSSTEQLHRLACLYRRELTVVKQWRVLDAHSERLSCRAILVDDLGQIGDWAAPWYVTWDPDGDRFRPVNVLGGELEEAASQDRIAEDDGRLPLYPEPLRHGQLPEGMRTRAIANLCELLRRQRPVTVCVLGYDLRNGDGGVTRVVLDGNHRLAAALRIVEEDPPGATADTTPPLRVLTFLIREEGAPVDDETSNEEQFPDWAPWRGFTPDIGLIRGTWKPPASTDRPTPAVG